ncbi:hypothetical protein CI102_15319 [Trichoderma harzianum]|uniref:C2H2-type domain-containing protein n=1 Tax=Trichoderma harzianum CBS 226.95 TaxID=983964 RepID=A0A2T4A5Q2_TRIHA|nr:hypothetical protein M431DRAFT_7792 [Trichoderma harzianum CBS 226.95]PKK34854.1 hypothetical protein CI102_15319 [Trichoderma harzianum]PTB52376.1 hypothetical protein M431DRAFT_7792 [Trichoderma harzianum CBS 226.95]
MASEDSTTMPSEINWEEFLKPLVEFNNRNPDGSLPEVDVPNNLNDQTSGIVEGNQLPEAVAPPNQVVEFDIDEYFDIDEFLAAAFVPAPAPPLVPAPATPFMALPAAPLVPAPVTPFVPALTTSFISAPVTTLAPALATSFNPAPATTPNPISGTSISNIPPTDGSGRPHICPAPECGARFAKRSALNTHMRSSKAHPHQNIKCRCGKGFSQYGLMQHLKQQVKRCKESREKFRCHCGFPAGPRAEDEILGHAYNCSRIRGKVDQ